MNYKKILLGTAQNALEVSIEEHEDSYYSVFSSTKLILLKALAYLTVPEVMYIDFIKHASSSLHNSYDMCFHSLDEQDEDLQDAKQRVTEALVAAKKVRSDSADVYVKLKDEKEAILQVLRDCSRILGEEIYPGYESIITPPYTQPCEENLIVVDHDEAEELKILNTALLKEVKQSIKRIVGELNDMTDAIFIISKALSYLSTPNVIRVGMIDTMYNNSLGGEKNEF